MVFVSYLFIHVFIYGVSDRVVWQLCSCEAVVIIALVVMVAAEVMVVVVIALVLLNVF